MRDAVPIPPQAEMLQFFRTILKKLRAKLGDNAAAPTYIFTEHGVGYRMATPGEA